ncbi:pogo transposable element with KRAB domain-like protein [Aphelenchoides avenae]|nr:pogo transposable element with KRAB domain-like protein [Aphelenchus avenae]
MLTACSDGTRIQPFVLLPYKEHKSKIANAIKKVEPPPPEVYLGWVLEAWYDGVTTENVTNSFETCGLTTALDGSEDHLVHCLKDGNGMPDGCYKMAQKREQIEADDLARQWPASNWISMKTT